MQSRRAARQSSLARRRRVVGASSSYCARPSLPAPGSEPTSRSTRAFYHGLAALEVGLLDDARQQFTQRHRRSCRRSRRRGRTSALTHLRLGELDAAAGRSSGRWRSRPTTRTSAACAGGWKSARGRLDEGVARLRRAVALDAPALRARFALAEELERAGTPEADAEALRCSTSWSTRAPRTWRCCSSVRAGGEGDRCRAAERLR